MHQLARDRDAGTYLCGLDPHIPVQSIPTKLLAMQTTMSQSSDHPHFILESVCIVIV